MNQNEASLLKSLSRHIGGRGAVDIFTFAACMLLGATGALWCAIDESLEARGFVAACSLGVSILALHPLRDRLRLRERLTCVDAVWVAWLNELNGRGVKGDAQKLFHSIIARISGS
jgi:hypothetical protein